MRASRLCCSNETTRNVDASTPGVLHRVARGAFRYTAMVHVATGLALDLASDLGRGTHSAPWIETRHVRIVFATLETSGHQGLVPLEHRR